MAPEPFAVLLICADREAAGRLATVIQARGHRVVAAPWSPAALSRASEAKLIIVDRINEPVTAPQAVARVKATPGLADTPLLAIAQGESVDERIALLEAGADDVMAHPIDQSELDARVDMLLVRHEPTHERHAPERPAPAVIGGPRLLTFFSAKGGVGTTMLAVNCAVALAQRRGRSVALLDLDMSWGQVATHLNLNPRLTIVELARDDAALQDPELVRSYAEHHRSGLAVFAAPQRPEEAALLTQQHVEHLLASLLDTFDLVLVDAGTLLDERTVTLISRSDRLVLLVSPEIPAVRATHNLLETLSEYEGPSERQLFVLNHIFAGQMVRTDDVQRSLQTRISLELPYDPLVYLKSINEGVPLVMSAPRSAPAERINRIVTQLVGELEQPLPLVADGQRKLRLAGLLRRG